MLFFALKCEKDSEIVPIPCSIGCISIKGSIRDISTGVGIENVKIRIKYHDILPTLIPVRYTFSDSSGNYEIKFSPDEKELKRDGDYQITASLENYFTTGDQKIYSGKIKLDSFYIFNLSMAPEAYINVRFYNKYPIDTNDIIYFWFSYVSFDQIYYYSNDCLKRSNLDYFIGTNVDTIKSCKIGGDVKSVISREVIKKGNSQIFRDTIIIPRFTTLDYLIEY